MSPYDIHAESQSLLNLVESRLKVNGRALRQLFRATISELLIKYRIW